MKSLFSLVYVVMMLVLLSCGGGKSSSGLSSMNSSLASPYKYFVYVANYSDNTISSFSMNRDTGVLTPIETVSAGSGGLPLSLAVSPSGDKLYVGKTFADTSPNFQTFNINKSNGALTSSQSFRILNNAILGNTSESISKVSASTDGRFVYAFSYEGGATLYTVSSITGNLTFTKAIGISPNTVSLIHPNGELLFWGSSNGITLWPVNKATGEVSQSGGASTASLNSSQLNSIVVSPDGSKMYSSYFVQGYGMINSYNLDLSNKSASNIGMTSVGSSSGGIAISNFGKVLIATEPNANKLHSYLINSSTSALSEIESKATENYPTQAVFFPDGQYALVINKLSRTISTFLVEENSGNLKSLSSIAVGTSPQDLVIVKE